MLSILPFGLLVIGPWATESPIVILEFEFGVGLELGAPASSLTCTNSHVGRSVRNVDLGTDSQTLLLLE